MKLENNCDHFLEKLEQYLDHELPQNEARRIQKHLEKCESCALRLKQLQEVDRIGSSDLFHSPGREFWENQKRQIMNSVSRENLTASKTVQDHWTKKLFTSTGFRYASGLSAAALLVFSIAVKSGYFEKNEVYTTPDIRVTEQAEQKTEAEQATSEKTKTGKETPEPVKVSQEKQTVEEKRPERTDEKTTDEKVEAPVTETVETTEYTKKPPVLTEDRVKIRSGDKTIKTSPLEKVPLEADPGKDIIRASESVNRKSNRDIFTSESLRLPVKEAEEFEAYIHNKELISTLDDLEDQKRSWDVFLEKLQGETVIGLVVNDIYEIYNKTVKAESDAALKKEALDFVIKHKDVLIVQMGDVRYERALLYLQKIQ